MMRQMLLVCLLTGCVPKLTVLPSVLYRVVHHSGDSWYMSLSGDVALERKNPNARQAT
jgi:hypothetical protein